MCVERIALQQVPQGQFQPHKECHKLHLTQVRLQSQPIREKLVMMFQRKNQGIQFLKNQRIKFLSYIQAEPYLHSGMGQVSFCQKALENFFSRGVDFKR